MAETTIKHHDLKRKRISCDDGPRKKHKQTKPTFSDPTALVTFLIGPNAKPFLVHKEVILNKSEVLAAAFSSNFIEGQTQTYHIDDTTEEVFRFFVQWLYSDKLEVWQLNEERKHDIRYILNNPKEHRIWIANENSENQTLAALWVLADKLCLPTLQNLVVEYIADISKLPNTWLPYKTYHYIYDNTSDDSPLRRLSVIQVATYFGAREFKKFSKWFPVEILVDFGAFMLERAGSGKGGIDEALEEEMKKCVVPVP
ncbi:uncharacterized protein PAC_01058 [Phialocephala subalpina]|uniref:BTB domain-containing protein n=1 Tax=Phialocephala subalpina TaxID=576137 RepID=A0A1L7WEG8_9HELO|nr:uncharacterized protein PAC_01058 [Phialocephala subalpina]